MSPAIYILTGLAIGAVLGGTIGWLAALRRASAVPADTRLENELRQQLAQRETSLAGVRNELNQSNAARAAAEAINRELAGA